VIEVQGLTKRYGQFAALTDISLKVSAGEIMVVLGPSGAGKTTLLRCINRLIEPSEGEVRMAGVPVPGDRAGLRRLRSQVGMIFQDHNLVPNLSVLKNVLLGRLSHMPAWLSLLQLFTDEDISIALDCLRRVDLESRAWNRANRLSGGQQQRVGIARALAQRPRAILADETVASLDPQSARLVLNDLHRAARDLSIAVLCNLHQVEYARDFADRIVGVSAGRVVFEGTPAQLDNAALARIYPGLNSAAQPATALQQRTDVPQSSKVLSQ